ncbi:MAG: SMC family ATPase, partial [Nanoarchaeota archaeon]|nr:SMC family ATPase [Nanoarchaeota archaeon]
MRFKKIKLANIRSYKDQEVIFPEGSLLLSGDVGCGKTTILMALEYALFGLQPGQKGSALLRNNESFGSVALELEVQGRNVLIERKLKRTVKGVSNEYASITIDGIKHESSVTEVKSKIVSLLGYPAEFVKKNNLLYRYTVHTAQEQMKEIIEEDAETRVNVLRHIFGVDKYRLIKNNLSILVNSLKGESKILQGEISSLDNDRENLEARKSAIKTLDEKIVVQKSTLSKKIENKQRTELELKELEKFIEEKRALEQEIEKTKIILSTKREYLLNLARDEEELRRLIAAASDIFQDALYSKLLTKISLIKQELEDLTSKNVELLAKRSQLGQETQDLLSKKERIFRIEICPTCLQDVPESHKHNILNETESRMAAIKNQTEGIETEKKLLSEQIALCKSQISEHENERVKMEILRARQEQTERAKNKLLETIRHKELIYKDQELLMKHLDATKEKLLEHSSLEIKWKNKEIELKKALFEEKHAEITLAELTRELELSRKEISLFEEAIRRKEQAKIRLYKTNELIDWLSAQFLKLIGLIERNVLLKLRKEFSVLFRKWFSMLISENSLDSQIDENFTPLILQGEIEMDYGYLS